MTRIMQRLRRQPKPAYKHIAPRYAAGMASRAGLMLSSALALLHPQLALAQTLDLDGPRAPEVGQSSILSEIARAAARDRSAPRRAIEQLGQRAKGDDQALVLSVVETTAELTELLALLAMDPALDPDSRRIFALQALTLHAGTPALEDLWLAHREAAIAAHNDASEANMRRWQASRHYLERYREVGTRHINGMRYFQSRDRDGAEIMPHVDDWAASAVGCIAPAAALLRSGTLATRWPEAPSANPADASPASQLVALLGEGDAPGFLARYTLNAPDSALTELRAVSANLQRAEGNWTHAPAARASARTLLAAMRFIEALQNAAPLLEEERDAAAVAALQAARGLLGPSPRPGAQAQMDVVRACARALESLDLLRDRRPTETRHLWTAMGRALVMANADSTREDAIRGAGLIERAARIAAQREALPPTPQVRTGQFKAYRDLMAQMDDAEKSVFEALPELLDHPQRIESPQTVSLLARYRTGVQDMATLLNAHRHIERLRSQRSDLGEDAATRLEAQIKALSDESTRTAALEQLKRFDDENARFDALPDYSVVRTPTAATSAVLGDSAPAFVQAVYDARESWLTAFGQDLPTDESARRAIAMNIVHELMDVAHALGEPHAEARLQEWAGWESPPGAVEMLARTAAEKARDAALVAARGEADEALRVANLAQRQTAAARAAATALRALTSADPASPTTGERARAVSVACQLSVEPTGDSVLANAREEYAELCRWLWERAAAEGRADGDLMEEIDVYLIECGAEAVEAGEE